MTLTSEQNEAWQKAINLLDHLDFHALSDAGLLESKSRLANLGVPKWAIPLRAQLITQGWYVQDREPWVPDFVLRSEVALVGLQIRHPIPEDAELAERRLVLRFVAEALRPFVEHARHADWYRRNGYTAIVNLFHLCEGSSATGSITRWPRDLRTYPKSFFCDLLLLCNPRRDQAKVEEVYWARTMGYDLLSDIKGMMNPDVLNLGDKPDSWGIGRVLDALRRQYRQCFQEDEHYTDRIAHAFLVALEAECPPPDWMPHT